MEDHAMRRTLASVAGLFAFALLVSGGGENFQATEIKLLAPAELPGGGGSFTLTASVDSVADLAGYQIQVKFYQNGVPVSGFTRSTTTEGELFAGQSTTSGSMYNGRYSMLDSGAVTGQGTLCSILFNYSSQLSGEYTIQAFKNVLAATDGTAIANTINSPPSPSAEARASWAEAARVSPYSSKPPPPPRARRRFRLSRSSPSRAGAA